VAPIATVVAGRRRQHMNFVSLRNELSHLMVEMQELTAMLTTAEQQYAAAFEVVMLLKL